MLSFSLSYPSPVQLFPTISSYSVCIPQKDIAVLSQSVTVLVMDRRAGKMVKWEIRVISSSWRIAFSQCPPQYCRSVRGRREWETTYGCNLKNLFLGTLTCGKSKSLSLGRLWEGKLEIWKRGKFRTPGGILSLSTKGGLLVCRGHSLVESWECLFTLD